MGPFILPLMPLMPSEEWRPLSVYFNYTVSSGQIYVDFRRILIFYSVISNAYIDMPHLWRFCLIPNKFIHLVKLMTNLI